MRAEFGEGLQGAEGTMRALTHQQQQLLCAICQQCARDSACNLRRIGLACGQDNYWRVWQRAQLLERRGLIELMRFGKAVPITVTMRACLRDCQSARNGRVKPALGEPVTNP